MKTLQDLLNLWIETWEAVFAWKKIITHAWENYEENGYLDRVSICTKNSLFAVSFVDVLFSPESNFFDTIFWEFEMYDLWDEWEESECYKCINTNCCNLEYWEETRCWSCWWEIYPLYEYHKIMAVLSPDPIQYCIDNIQRPE